jgi:hypothetical protein
LENEAERRTIGIAILLGEKKSLGFLLERLVESTVK